MPLTTTPDHVAAAVPDLAVAEARWCDQLGGGLLGGATGERGFATQQVVFAGGARLELIAPSSGGEHPRGDFVTGFLERFGAQVHHVTLKVSDLDDAVATLTAEGFDVVDVSRPHPLWHEAFLRPKQVGGLVVQIAWAGRTVTEWAEQAGAALEPSRPDAATLLGPRLAHPDLDEAARVWSVLGADVTWSGDRIACRWDGEPMSIEIVRGEVAGPVGLRFLGAVPAPPDPELGPAVLAAR